MSENTFGRDRRMYFGTLKNDFEGKTSKIVMILILNSRNSRNDPSAMFIEMYKKKKSYFAVFLNDKKLPSILIVEYLRCRLNNIVYKSRNTWRRSWCKSLNHLGGFTFIVSRDVFKQMSSPRNN